MVQGKADIMDNLKDWTGNVFMCDAYAGYDWMKKIDGLVLCRRMAHARRMAERSLRETHSCPRRRCSSTKTPISWRR